MDMISTFGFVELTHFRLILQQSAEFWLWVAMNKAGRDSLCTASPGKIQVQKWQFGAIIARNM